MKIISIQLQRVNSLVRLHQHGYHEIHYIVSGRGMFECDGEMHEIAPGTFFFTGPGMCHRMMREGGPIVKYNVHVRFAEAGEMAALMDVLLARRRFRDIGTSHRYFFEGIRVRFASTNVHLALAAKHEFIAFLHTLASGVTPAAGARASAVLEPVLQLMHEHMHEKLTLARICGETGLSRRSLIRLFNDHIGMPPMTFLSRMRIDAACHLLNTGSLTLTEIARELGFADEFHFSKVFKRWMGMPPSTYRKEENC